MLAEAHHERTLVLLYGPSFEEPESSLAEAHCERTLALLLRPFL
jgi:hypothetical protein